MEYYIWLSLVLRFGCGKSAALLERFGTAEAVYKADIAELRECGLLSHDAILRASDKSLLKAREIVSYCKKHGISVITYADSRYPLVLKNIPDLPPVFYCRGVLPQFDEIPSVSIVGPRKCSDYGIKAAYSLAARLSLGGMAIVSGGAVGVDAAAHEGALSAEAVTVAVLPCGFGYDYLRRNEVLRERIIENGGCIITEYPPDEPVRPGAFQVRNRLISALSLGTVIIEAGEKSGALITARHALEQGKDIFVIPGNPSLPEYAGSNKLLRDGAHPLLDARDIFDEYIGAYYDKLDIGKAFSHSVKPMKIKTENKTAKSKTVNSRPAKAKAVTASPSTEGLSGVAAAILSALPNSPFCVDELSVYKDYNAAELMTAMAELELCGCISAIPGGRYVKE